MKEQKTIQIPKELSRLLDRDWREAAVYGGRFSLKSHTVARVLLIRARQEKIRVGCFREFQNAISESSHQLLKDLIDLYEMTDFKDELKIQREEDRKDWNRKWGDLANKMGTIVEDIVAPNIPRIAREYFDCEELEDFMVRRSVVNKKDRSIKQEFDVIAVCRDKVIINETKSKARKGYIDEFIELLNDIFSYFPEYKSKSIIPVFASLYIPENIIKYLSKNNIYAMTMGEESMEILNADEVQIK